VIRIKYSSARNYSGFGELGQDDRQFRYDFRFTFSTIR